MPVGTILFIITVVAAGIGMAIFFFTKGAGPNWLWRGGRGDLMRTILFRDDGSWRRYGKLGVLLFWLAIACATYFFKGTNAG